MLNVGDWIQRERGDGMKKVTVIFTDDTRGKFDCKNVSYDRHVAFLGTVDGKTVVIPYYHMYMIEER